ncbi:MAG: pyridoxamine 5'-phosphate oxidase family protein [Leptolyngbya sp. SIOISBB]|nr:pyridoxamine 5'-phosphate oxidase family protein [Leptolyngbya sp. SIOISBB]
MGKVFTEISESMQAWVEKQKIFFVATAPLSDSGHVNCSPKGADSLRILSPTRVAYQDLTGSGVETIAHIRENGRIVIMLCAFEGPPQIVRFFGQGTYLPKGSEEFQKLAGQFEDKLGWRAIITVDVTRVGSSCGYSVPFYDFVGDRDVLDKWTAAKGAAGLDEYQKMKNAQSIDGLPGLKF